VNGVPTDPEVGVPTDPKVGVPRGPGVGVPTDPEVGVPTPCKPKRSNSLTILTFLTYWSTKSSGSMKSR